MRRAVPLLLGLLVACGGGGGRALPPDVPGVDGDAPDLHDVLADPGGAESTRDAGADASELPPFEPSPDAPAEPGEEARPELPVEVLEIEDVPEMPADLDATPPDPAADPDGDGVSNADEAAAGTDPLDPASAPAWHPEYAVRPRLFVGPDNRATLQARAAAPGPVHAVLLERMRQRALAPPPAWPADGSFDDLVGAAQAEVSVNAAFLGWLGDAAMTEKALALLEAPVPSSSGVPMTVKYDLSGAETLVDLCTAFDLLAGTPDVPPERLAVARERLVGRVDEFRQLCVAGSQAPVLAFANNNHNLKVLAALGTCALALPDRSGAARDANDAVTGIDTVLNHWQGTAEGGYAEGAYYLAYGGVSTLPFLVAWHRFANGAPHVLRHSGIAAPPEPDDGALVSVPDFAANPRTREIYLRALWSLAPDGHTPPTDDGNAGLLHGALLGWLFDDPRFTWGWLRPASGPYTQRTEVQSFALYDGGPGEAPTWAPDGLWAEAGFAVLRSGLGPDDSYLLLQGEHGDARTHGGGHEHVDATSFLLWAGGEYLALDPGYIDFDHHGLVRFARDHNLVLVDGEGAPVVMDTLADVDAWLDGLQVDSACSTARVTAAYQGVQITRRVTRLGPGGPFVVTDALGADAPHAYTWQLNGNGGGEVPDGSFEPLPDGARWARPKAALRAVVVPTEGPATYGHRLEEHAPSWGTWQQHEALTVDATMEQRAGFLALLVVEPSGLPAPEVAAWQPAPGLAVGVAGERSMVWNRTDQPAVVELAGAPVQAPPGFSAWHVGDGGAPVLDCAPDSSL